MFTTFYKLRDGKTGNIDFQVGKPVLMNPELFFSGVTMVRVDGRELQLIKERFRNLPWIEGSDVMCYYGETAQMLTVNLHQIFVPQLNKPGSKSPHQS